MTPDEIIQVKLGPWVNNPPDFHDMTEAYDTYASLRSQIIQKKRDIERVEDEVTSEEDKPRSNEARKKRLHATVQLKDQLADLEAAFAFAESTIKKLEYRKDMFKSANYKLARQYDVA